MKNKSLDKLMSSLQDQKEAVILNPEGKSTQYFCSVGGYAKDDGNNGNPPN